VNTINPDRYGFHAFRENWPNYTKSAFMNKTEIVTDGSGTILGVTNPEKLLWAKIPDSAEDIQILSVAPNAFSNCTKLREITFSDNLETVGSGAFSGCTMLSSVSLPDGVYELGEGAFEKSGLRSFVFPSDLEYVPPRCFSDCASLESVTLSVKIRRIGILAFAGCRSLRSFEIPYSVHEVSEGCFMGSGLRSLYLPHELIRIGASALSGCKDIENIFYDGTAEDFRRVEFGRNWNRGMNKSCILYVKDDKGYWYNAFSEEKKRVHEEDDIKKDLALFDLETVPTKSELDRIYRKKAMAFHPDRLSGLELDEEYTHFAEEKFRLYRQAYERLLKFAKP
jgi:hypothetical protein